MQSEAGKIDLTLATYDRVFLERSWVWLNDPEIKALTLAGEFDREGQARWFESLHTRSDYFIWGVSLTSGEPIGVCGIKGVSDKAGEYWGYIGEKRLWGQGLGKSMVSAVEQKACDMSLARLWLRVWDQNERAIRLYRRLGFVHDRRDGSQIVMAKELVHPHRAAVA